MRPLIPKLTLVRNSPAEGIHYDEDWGRDYYAYNRFEVKRRNGTYICVKEVELLVLSHSRKLSSIPNGDLKPSKFFFDKFIRYSDKPLTVDEQLLIDFWCTDDVVIESDLTLTGVISARDYPATYKSSRGCLMYVTQLWFEEYAHINRIRNQS